jgi:hypothetical protein
MGLPHPCSFASDPKPDVSHMSSMPIAQWFVTIGVVACVILMAYGGALVTGSEAGKGARH